MVKLKIIIHSLILIFALAFVAGPVQAATPEQQYKELYKGSSTGGSMCTTKTKNTLEAKSLVTQSIDVNLKRFKDDVVSRIEQWGNNTAKAIMTASAIMTNDIELLGAKLKKADEAALRIEQRDRIQEKTLDALQSARLSAPEKQMVTGLSMYQPDLTLGARQAEMQRYISELNNVPLNNQFRDSEGYPLPGYVDTSKGMITAMGQEFRNFVRFFCDVRSINGKLASTRYLEYDSKTSGVSEYWCGKDRNVLAPEVSKDPKSGFYVPLEGEPLKKYVAGMVKREEWLSYSGNGKKGGKSYLIDAPKNVADLYFEPHTLDMDKDIYEKAEQQFARFVIGRANDLNNQSSYEDGVGQRTFMNQQARIAKLALARYPFAEMFARKTPTMPAGSAGWAADMIEKNIGDCKKPAASYKSLCDLTKQLRNKGRISESEFYDVLFNRQFQGMAFAKSTLGMTQGQLKRMQANLMGLQLALAYQRNRLKQEQLLLLAALAANENK